MKETYYYSLRHFLKQKKYDEYSKGVAEYQKFLNVYYEYDYYYNVNNFDGITDIAWRYHGPYLGTGFDFGLFCGFSFFIDLGVVFTNRAAKMSIDIPHEQLYVYDIDTETWSPVTIPRLDSDVAQATHDANRKLSDFKFYPMIKAGFAYRF